MMWRVEARSNFALYEMTHKQRRSNIEFGLGWQVIGQSVNKFTSIE